MFPSSGWVSSFFFLNSPVLQSKFTVLDPQLILLKCICISLDVKHHIPLTCDDFLPPFKLYVKVNLKLGS